MGWRWPPARKSASICGVGQGRGGGREGVDTWDRAGRVGQGRA